MHAPHTTDKAQGYVTEVTYPSNYYRDLNPNIQALAVAGAGFTSRARAGEPYTYIELGCGGGLSTLIHAAANPQSRFIGVDINPAHLTLARHLAAEAGLDNVEFRELAFADLASAKLPRVDTVAMHGVWSWISVANRSVIQTFAEAQLNPGGILYLSYNAMPGMASILPLREAMMIGFRAIAGKVTEKVEAGLMLAHNVRRVDAAYFRANPLLGQYLDDITPLARNYLAHEYFNADWWAFYHHEIVAQMAPLGLRYAASSNIMDNLEALTLSPEMRALADAVADPIDRETLKDVFLNRQFRRDIFVRCDMQRADPRAALQAIPFAAAVLPDNVDRIVGTTPRGEVRPRPDITHAIISALAEGAAAAVDLLERPALAFFPPAKVLDTLMTLAALGAIEPALPHTTLAARKARTGRLNVLLWERSLAGHNINATAAAVTGGGIGLSRTEQLFLLAHHRGADPVALVADAMPDQKRETVAEAYATFAAGPCTLLRNLGVA